MAGSRLEKVGSIFTRTTGLLRSGAMKIDDKPIWYDVFVAHPPILEPRYDRSIPNIRLKNIFFKEDQIRAKFHNAYRTLGAINLSADDSSINSTTTQMFIKIYENLHKQGAIDEEQIFETSLELLRDKLQQPKDTNNKDTIENDDGFVGNDRGQNHNHESSNLLKNFIEAKNDNSKIVDIKHIFKE